jgi:hypothetical protein
MAVTLKRLGTPAGLQTSGGGEASVFMFCGGIGNVSGDVSYSGFGSMTGQSLSVLLRVWRRNFPWW